MDLRFISKWITFVFLWGTESRTLWRRTDWLAYFGMRGIPTFPSCWTKETKPCSVGFAIFAMLHVWHWQQEKVKTTHEARASAHFFPLPRWLRRALWFTFSIFMCLCSVCPCLLWAHECVDVHVCTCGGLTLMTRVIFLHSSTTFTEAVFHPNPGLTGGPACSEDLLFLSRLPIHRLYGFWGPKLWTSCFWGKPHNCWAISLVSGCFVLCRHLHAFMYSRASCSIGWLY